MSELGKWVVLDLETSSAVASEDSIIDIGFFQFEELKLVNKFSSLVRYEDGLSQFIQKLTGISNQMALKAPLFETIEHELYALEDHHLLAHNAAFEKSFLDITVDVSMQYQDSIDYLSLLNPLRTHMSLESFIVDDSLAEKETHRGLEDARDLLKVLLVETYKYKVKTEEFSLLKTLAERYYLDDQWFYNFFCLTKQQLLDIAGEIDFDLQEHFSLKISPESSSTSSFEHNAHQTKDRDNTDDVTSYRFNGEDIKKILGPGGAAQTVFPDYRARPGQEQMSLRVGQSLNNSVHCMIQAPTGTGKTLGYLLPAILFSREKSTPVLVAIATKTLQEQVVGKDVPLALKILGNDFSDLKTIRLLGSANYLCVAVFRQMVAELDMLDLSNDKSKAFAYLYMDYFFSQVSLQDSFSDSFFPNRADIPYVLLKKHATFAQLERDIVVNAKSCTASKCPFFSQCSYMQSMQEAGKADIIIGNHALMFTWPGRIKRPEHIIVDEAHKIESETTNAFAMDLYQHQLQHLHEQMLTATAWGSLYYLISVKDSSTKSQEIIEKLKKDLQIQATMLGDQLLDLPQKFETYFKLMPRYTAEFWNEAAFDDKDKNLSQLSVEITNHLESICFILQQTHEIISPYLQRWDMNQMQEQNEIIAWVRFNSFADVFEDYIKVLHTVFDSKSGYARSLKYHEKEGFAICCMPIDTGQLVHDHLLQTTASVVFTSATLANHQGDQGHRGMEWTLGHLYLQPQKRFKSGFYLPAVFDYRKNVRVFLCDDAPPLYEQCFVQDVIASLIPTVRKLEGRSLLLFSARKRFEQAREILLKEFEMEIPLFIQGMGNNVIEEYKKSPQGILLGMEAFAEGIDIPGKALQFLFIDKIPDLRIEHVTNLRRNFFDQNFGNEFNDYYLTGRCRSLHQKLGRLLRTEKDIGGVVIVDQRTRKWKQKTHHKFNQLMQPYCIERAPIKSAVKKIEEFLLQD